MKIFTFSNWLIILLGIIAIMGLCFTPAFADELEDGMEIQDDNFGQNYQYTWIPCYNFTPHSPETEWNMNNNGNYKMFSSNYHGYMYASINLPSGAYLNIARLYYYDNSSAANIGMEIHRYDVFNNKYFLGRVTSSGTPGYFSNNVTINHTIANANNMYSIKVAASGDGGSIGFMGVRLYWKRQVRTGLANPFNDIGHLNSRFQNAIKAMAASGITGGCGGGSFCPGNYVTRGQMAVFLAEALGLHWAFPY